VRVSGEGIASKDLPYIRGRYYRSTGAAKNPGSGPGLALVKGFVEAMGGSVALESEVGRGSCFTIRLPQTRFLPPRIARISADFTD
jgi:signal transduction histidine kinase